jgi:hypothetical protein
LKRERRQALGDRCATAPLQEVHKLLCLAARRSMSISVQRSRRSPVPAPGHNRLFAKGSLLASHLTKHVRSVTKL